MRFTTLMAVRITANPAAIDAASWPAGAIMVRVAPDDALVIDATVDDAAAVAAADPHAIIEPEAMFRGAWLDAAQLTALTHSSSGRCPPPGRRWPRAWCAAWPSSW
jgi:hypothetical protein